MGRLAHSHDAVKVVAQVAHRGTDGPVEQGDRGIASLGLAGIAGRKMDQQRSGRRIVQGVAFQRRARDLVMGVVVRDLGDGRGADSQQTQRWAK